MKRCKNCGDPRIVIVSKTTFGHGDSTTITHAECVGCATKTETICDYGFPAKYETIRAVQYDFNKNYQS